MNYFIEKQFPVDISYGAMGGPSFLTHITTSRSGYEYRNQCWQYPRGRYNVSHGVKTKEQFAQLMGFFRNCCGKAVGFRFKDWMDFQADDVMIAIGDGQETEFQLVKHYPLDWEHVSARIITKPIASTFSLRVDGHVCRDEEYSLDDRTGMVELREAPVMGAPICASFEFDVPVRFDCDTFHGSMDAWKSYGMQAIELVELR